MKKSTHIPQVGDECLFYTNGYGTALTRWEQEIGAIADKCAEKRRLLRDESELRVLRPRRTSVTTFVFSCEFKFPTHS